MIPERYAPLLFALILSGLMSCLVSGIATVKTMGFSTDFVAQWMGNWRMGWAVAFPTVLLVAPIARKIVGFLTGQARGESEAH